MVNQAPGSSQTTILSFSGGFHGRTYGALSATRSKPIHKLGVAAFEDWPVAPFPSRKYPLAEYEEHNAAEEQRCLECTDEIMREHKARGRDVAAVIVEPIQAEGGDNGASSAFFRALRSVVKKVGVHSPLGFALPCLALPCLALSWCRLTPTYLPAAVSCRSLPSPPHAQKRVCDEICYFILLLILLLASCFFRLPFFLLLLRSLFIYSCYLARCRLHRR